MVSSIPVAPLSLGVTVLQLLLTIILTQDDSSSKKKGKGTMLVTINQDEIAEAVQTFVQSRGVSTEGHDIKVTFTAGRGTNGMTASIEITPKTNTPQKATRRRTTKKAKEVKSVLQEETPQEEPTEEDPLVEPVESILAEAAVLEDMSDEEDELPGPQVAIDDDDDDEQESLFGN